MNWKSYSDVRDAIQASDEELKQALRTKRILEVNGFLRPLSQAYLNNALELMLNTFVSLNAPKDAIPVVDVLETLQSDHDISRDVMLQIMAWFGELGDAPSLISQASTWKMDIHAVVRQIGLGILSRHQVCITIHLFLVANAHCSEGNPAIESRFHDAVAFSMGRQL